jgi:hypothetical protein
MADVDPFQNQAQDQAQNQAQDQSQSQGTEQTAKEKAAGLKDKLDVNHDGKTDADDLKSMAKGATDKVKGLLNKK